MIRIFFIAIIVTLLSSSVSASIAIGISPGIVKYDEVLRGGFDSRHVTITTNSEESINVNLVSDGEIGEWLSYPENLEISRQNPGRFFLELTPPEDMPNGNYSGILRVQIDDSSLDSQGFGSSVKGVVDLAIFTEIIDLEIFECRASGYEIYRNANGEYEVNVNVLNLGNVRFIPSLNVIIWDETQSLIISEQTMTGDFSLPTQEQKQTFQINAEDIQPGNYWFDLSIPECESSDLINKDIRSPNEIVSFGNLGEINIEGEAEVGGLIRLKVLFENGGEQKINAFFEGNIKSGGEAVKYIRTPEFEISPNTAFEFEIDFEPISSGNYILEGDVYYEGNKEPLFYEFRVENKQSKFINIIYLIIFLLIGYLLYKIFGEMKKRLK